MYEIVKDYLFLIEDGSLFYVMLVGHLSTRLTDLEPAAGKAASNDNITTTNPTVQLSKSYKQNLLSSLQPRRAK